MKLSNCYRDGLTFIVPFILIVPICSVLSDSSSQPSDGQVDRKLIDRQTELITSGFSSIFWNYIRRSEQSLNHVSIDCLKSLNSVLQSTLTGQPWAFKLMSASGSMPNHFLDGSYSAFGSYDSCLELSQVTGDSKLSSEDTKDGLTIKGQYCLTSLEPDTLRAGQSEGQFLKKLYPHHFDSQFNLSIKVGLCIPSACSQDDVEQLMSQAFYDYNWRLIDVHSCEVDTTIYQRLKSANRGQQICLWLIGSLIATVVWGTYLDITSPSVDDKSSHLFWIKQFSVTKSVKSFFRKPNSSPKLFVLDKLRLLSYSIVLILHAFMWFAVVNAGFILDQTGKGVEMYKHMMMQPFANDWITEGLFVLGGIGAGINMIAKMRPEMPFTAYLKEIVRRAVLLIPPLTILISLEVIIPFLGSGPIFNSISSARSAVCIKNYLYNIFHIQNNCIPLEMCASHTWSIAVEWQLFILLSIAIYIYKRNYRLGVAFNIFMIFFGFLAVHRVIIRHNVKPFFIMPTAITREMAYNRMANYYLSMESHIWSYFSGLLIVMILLGNYESRLKATFGRLRFQIMVFITVILSYSSAPWNVFGMEVRTSTTIITSIITKISTIIWCSLVLLYSGKRIRNFLANSKSNDIYIYKDLPDARNEDIPNNKQLANHNNNSILTTNDSYNYSNGAKNGPKSGLLLAKYKSIHRFEIISRLFRSAYFSHSFVYILYFTNLKSSIPFSFIHLFMIVTTLFILSLVGGFIFSILVVGPIERILYILRNGPVKSKIN